MSRLNIAICRIALSVGLLAAVVTAQAQNICSNGEQRCRSDGHIENCIGGLMWSKSPQLCGESKQKITVEKTVTTQEICTEGDQKCGPRETLHKSL